MEGLRAGQVTVVQPSVTVIEVFVLVDIQNGGLFNRPAVSTGAFDTANK